MINKKHIIKHILNHCKEKNNCHVGVEFECFLYNKKDISPVSFSQISDILKSFDSTKWKPVIDNNLYIGLQSNIGNISLEPGGQLEFSSVPCVDLHEEHKFIKIFLDNLSKASTAKDVGIYLMGYQPKHSTEDIPLFPKERYLFMYDYMNKVGKSGREMMKKTCTLQTNLDYTSESDLIKKIQVSMRLQPIVIALFANSPFKNKMITNNLSQRMLTWQNTDKDRVGFIKNAFNDNFSLEEYIDYALNIPMYFIIRNGKYIYNHQTFKELLENHQKQNLSPITIEDFMNHLGTIFPYVRLKTYIEIRSADCPDVNLLDSLSALFLGIFYSNSSLEKMHLLTKNWEYEELLTLEKEVIQKSFHTSFKGRDLKDIITEILTISKQGLLERNLNEEIFIDPLFQIINNKSLAELKIDLFNQENKDVNRFIEKITINPS